MIIIAGADFHGSLPTISNPNMKNPDLLVLAGDIPPHDSSNINVLPNGFRQFHRSRESDYQREWSEKRLGPWVNGVNPKNTIYVAGNHCFLNPEDLTFVTHGLKTGAQTIEIDGKKIGLLAGSMNFTGEWEDECDEQEMTRRINLLDPDIELLISHVPPHGLGDVSRFGGHHIGSTSLVNAITGYEPRFTQLKLHFYGHCHEGAGEYEVNGVQFANVALKAKKFVI